MKNIVLVGFMGAGKSVVGKKLATVLKRKLVSTDDLITAREKRPISEIFKDSGEPYFRNVEQEIVAEVSRDSNLVIDCGGGVVINPVNVSNLKKNGVVIYLKAGPDVIYGRVKHETHRPLLNVPDPQAKIAELLNARKPYYEQADHAVDTSTRTPDEIASEIIKLVS